MELDWRIQATGDLDLHQKTQGRRKLALDYWLKLRMETLEC